ncbi:MAG: LysM peptidoglycan-binding domain-containing protein [Vulcanibacillus sp.]
MAKIYLSQSEEIFELPILPEEIEIKEKSENKNHTLQNVGEITIINTVNLATLNLKGLFPIIHAPFVSSLILKEPNEYINILKKWRSTKLPLRIVITDTAFPFTWACTIESFEYKEIAGEVGDIYYSLELKEYRYSSIKKISLVKTEQQTIVASVVVNRPVEKVIPKTYTVQNGDTLYAICKKQLGDGNKYKEVAQKNNIKNPNLINPGQVLYL